MPLVALTGLFPGDARAPFLLRKARGGMELLVNKFRGLLTHHPRF